MQESIFTKIIKGEVPCHKVHEDERIIIFLDIHPLTPGHMLVVPKNQVDHFDDLPAEDHTALFAVVRRAAKQLKQVLQPERVCLRVEGFDVPHAHVHVYPCNKPADFYGQKDRAQIESDHSVLSDMAKKLAF